MSRVTVAILEGTSAPWSKPEDTVQDSELRERCQCVTGTLEWTTVCPKQYCMGAGFTDATWAVYLLSMTAVRSDRNTLTAEKPGSVRGQWT